MCVCEKGCNGGVVRVRLREECDIGREGGHCRACGAPTACTERLHA